MAGNIKHSQITDPNEIHYPKGFVQAPPGTGLIKNELGELEYRPLDVLGAPGPQGPQGPDGTAVAQLVVVQTAPGPGQYSDPIAALESITDSSPTKPYILDIAPGIYNLSAPLVLPQYVLIRARAGMSAATFLYSGTPTNNIIEISQPGCGIQGLILANSYGAGAAAIKITDSAESVVIDSVTIDNCTVGILAELPANNINILIRDSVIKSGASTSNFAKLIASGGFSISATIDSTKISNNNNTLFTDGILVDGAALTFKNSSLTSSVNFGNGIRCLNGAYVTLTGCEITGFSTNFKADNTGSAPIINGDGAIINGALAWDLDIRHVNATGHLSCVSRHDRVFIPDSASLRLSIKNSTGPASMRIHGDIIQDNKYSEPVNLSKLSRSSSVMGLISGGTITSIGGLNVSISAGNGFVVDSVTGAITEVSWGPTIESIPSEASRYICVNSSGAVFQSASLPNLKQNIVLGRVVTLSTDVDFVEPVAGNATQYTNDVALFQREALGPIYVNGGIVSENPGVPRALDVTSGNYWFVRQFLPSGGITITFSQYYRDGGSGFNVITGLGLVDNTSYDNGSGILQPLGAGKYAKHTLYQVGDGAYERYFLVTSQTQYNTLVEAEGAPLPLPPSSFDDAVTLLAAIIVQQGTTNILKIIDHRPVIGFKAPSVSAAAVHNNLLGRDAADAHSQYLNRDGSAPMIGNLNMGGFNVNNVGLVDGIDPSAHGHRHLPDGPDGISTGTPTDISDNTNSPGTANTYVRSDHVHAHGNRGGGSLHAVAVGGATPVSGFMSGADKVKLDSFSHNFIQYSNSTSQSNATTTMQSILLQTDLGSVSGGLFTKLSDQVIRVNFSGHIALTYSVSIYEAGNNRGSFVQVIRNGVLVTGTYKANSGSSTISYSTVTHRQIISVVDGDTFQLQFASSVATQTSTIPIDGAFLLLEAFNVSSV